MSYQTQGLVTNLGIVLYCFYARLLFSDKPRNRIVTVFMCVTNHCFLFSFYLNKVFVTFDKFY